MSKYTKWGGPKFDEVAIGRDIYEFDTAFRAARPRLDRDLIREIRWLGYTDVVVARTYRRAAGGAILQCMHLSDFGVKLMAALRAHDEPAHVVRAFLHDNPRPDGCSFDEAEYEAFERQPRAATERAQVAV